MALKRSLGLLGVLALVVSACSGGTTATTPPAGTPAAGGSAPASAAAQSGDLKFVMDAEPTYFSLAYTDLPTAYINGEIYTGMYRVNNKLAVIPDMATALPTISADGLTWTITLKDGIKWQNGDPFTSADVVFTFQLAASPNCTFIPSFCSDIQGNVASVTAPDAKTVVFTLKQKFAPFLVTDLTTLIMPQKAVMASFATFQQSSSAVSASDVKALDDQITTATTDKACDGSANQPASCDYATYVSQMEAILQKAGVGLGSGQLNKTLYVKSDGTPDNTAYGNALYNALADLDKTLAATQTDQVAAAFRLLDFQNKPVGTGPFMFDNYQPGQSVTLDANPNYYAGTVPPQHMYFPIIKDAASGAAALQKGDANWLYSVVSDALPALQADPTIQMATYADFGYYFIAFNLRPGHIYSDINLREAFSMCIDHDATVSKATDGQGIPVYADIPPASWAFDPNAPKYTLDVAGAKAKIESSGWTLGADGIYTKGGQRLSTTLYVRAGPAAHQLREPREGSAQGVRHRDQRPAVGLLDGAPAAPQLPQQVRYVPGWLVHGARSGRQLDLRLQPDHDQGKPERQQLPRLVRPAGGCAVDAGPRNDRPGAANPDLLAVPGHRPQRSPVLLPVGGSGLLGAVEVDHRRDQQRGHRSDDRPQEPALLLEQRRLDGGDAVGAGIAHPSRSA